MLWRDPKYQVCTSRRQHQVSLGAKLCFNGRKNLRVPHLLSVIKTHTAGAPLRNAPLSNSQSSAAAARGGCLTRSRIFPDLAATQRVSGSRHTRAPSTESLPSEAYSADKNVLRSFRAENRAIVALLRWLNRNSCKIANGNVNCSKTSNRNYAADGRAGVGHVAIQHAVTCV